MDSNVETTREIASHTSQHARVYRLTMYLLMSPRHVMSRDRVTCYHRRATRVVSSWENLNSFDTGLCYLAIERGRLNYGRVLYSLPSLSSFQI